MPTPRKARQKAPADPTAAERNRRYRRHRADDHSLCSPDRCPVLSAAPDDPPDAPTPAPRAAAAGPSDYAAGSADGRFGPRGAQLWAEMSEVGLGPAHRVLLEEACRMADRLDRLDAMLAGREDWIRLRSPDPDDPTTFVLMVDSLLGEARQHAATFKSLVGELRAAMPKVPARSPAGKGGGLSGLGDFSAKLAARRGATSG